MEAVGRGWGLVGGVWGLWKLMAYYLYPEIQSFLHSGLINGSVYTFGPPDDGTLGFTTTDTLVFGRTRVKGTTKL